MMDYKKGNVYIWMIRSLGCIAEISTTGSINYTLKKKLRKNKQKCSFSHLAQLRNDRDTERETHPESIFTPSPHRILSPETLLSISAQPASGKHIHSPRDRDLGQDPYRVFLPLPTTTSDPLFAACISHLVNIYWANQVLSVHFYNLFR